VGLAGETFDFPDRWKRAHKAAWLSEGWEQAGAEKYPKTRGAGRRTQRSPSEACVRTQVPRAAAPSLAFASVPSPATGKLIFFSLLQAVIDDDTFQNSQPLTSEAGRDRICGMSIQRTFMNRPQSPLQTWRMHSIERWGTTRQGWTLESIAYSLSRARNYSQDDVVAKTYTVQPCTLPMTSPDHVDLTRYRW
jgi:hypothetical protein